MGLVPKESPCIMKNIWFTSECKTLVLLVFHFVKLAVKIAVIIIIIIIIIIANEFQPYRKHTAFPL